MGTNDILTILSLSLHKHHVYFLISFKSIWYFSLYEWFTFLVKLIPKYFILFNVIISATPFLISFLYCSLFSIQKYNCFGLWILCPATLLKEFINVCVCVCAQSLVFSTDKILTSKNRRFYLFLCYLDAFSFVLLNSSRTSSTMFKRRDESGYYCLVPDLG